MFNKMINVSRPHLLTTDKRVLSVLSSYLRLKFESTLTTKTCTEQVRVFFLYFTRKPGSRSHRGADSMQLGKQTGKQA